MKDSESTKQSVKRKGMSFIICMFILYLIEHDIWKSAKCVHLFMGLGN